MRRPGHPSMRKLHHWIEEGDESVESHLLTCSHCAGRLESILNETETDIGRALAELLAVPDELPDRLRANIETRLNNRHDLMLLGELFGVPFRTARIMTNTQGES